MFQVCCICILSLSLYNRDLFNRFSFEGYFYGSSSHTVHSPHVVADNITKHIPRCKLGATLPTKPAMIPLPHVINTDRKGLYQQLHFLNEIIKDFVEQILRIFLTPGQNMERLKIFKDLMIILIGFHFLYVIQRSQYTQKTIFE